MEENIDTSTSIEEKKFTCIFDGCQAVFGRRNRLEQHIRIHTGEVKLFKNKPSFMT